MAKRKIDSALIASTMQALKEQPAPNESFAKSEDPNYPVWRPEVKKQYLVYFPMTPCRRDANGVVVADPLTTWQHATQSNGGFANIRCFNGFANEALGFDGTCPLCDAAKECGQEYSMKLNFEASRLGISEVKDNPALEGTRTKLNSERAVKRAEEYITFPIVVLTENPQIPLRPEDKDNFKVYFMEMRKSTYDEKIVKILESQVPRIAIEPSDAPFGKLFTFNYNYNSNGAEPNIRDAVRNVQYTPVVSMEYYQSVAPLLAHAEELAKTFTNEKAVEVIKASQLWYHDDYVKTTDTIMLQTRSFIASAQTGATPMMTGIEQTLSAFGATPAPASIGGVTAPALEAVPAPASTPVAASVSVAPQIGAAPTTAPMGVPATPQIGAAPAPAVTPVAPQIGAVQ